MEDPRGLTLAKYVALRRQRDVQQEGSTRSSVQAIEHGVSCKECELEGNCQPLGSGGGSMQGGGKVEYEQGCVEVDQRAQSQGAKNKLQPIKIREG